MVCRYNATRTTKEDDVKMQVESGTEMIHCHTLHNRIIRVVVVACPSTMLSFPLIFHPRSAFSFFIFSLFPRHFESLELSHQYDVR
jgi:hypothetical protein